MSVAEKAAQIAEHIAAHNSHGYSQPNRMGNGTTETVALSDGSKVTIHGGDYDCSEMVRVCVNAALSGTYKGPIEYMWTGSQDEEMRAVGYERVSLGSIVRGDVLMRSGHTAIYLGGGKIGEAHHGDYAGGLDGRKGDQDGTEVRIATYYASAWTRAYHFPEPGGNEDESEMFEVQKTVTVMSHTLNVRDAPSVTTGSIVAKYRKGDTINIDGVVFGGLYAWGHYIGGTSGKDRYIALGTLENAR